VAGPAVLSSVREQYERFPYPPIPWLALPSKGEGRGLAYAYGRELVQASPFAQALAANDRPRILVAGCGTFEPVVAAMANPDAAEIVAVDLSATSLERLEKRLRFASVVSRWSSSRRRALNPPLRLVRADLFDWEDGQFDFIIASNVLHHVQEPDLLLRRLAGWLGPGGLLRMVTYAQHSRLWLRNTGA